MGEITPLQRVAEALIRPLAVGDEVIPGWTLDRVSVELGARLRLSNGDRALVIELAPLSEGLRHAVATAQIGVSYRAGSHDAAVPTALGLALCQAIAAVVRTNENAVLRPMPARAEPRVREVSVQTLLEPMGTTEDPYFGLSPYVGCLVGCRFCYAQSRLAGARRLAGLPQVAWGSWVDARTNAADVLRRELQTGPRLPIKFSPIVSDPYQAAEARLGITRQCIEVIASVQAPPPTLVLTRCAAILNDIERIAAIERAFVGVSMPTLDESMRRHFEPRAASVAERLEILRVAKAAGIATIAVVQPQLPGSAEALADALTEVADSVRVDVLTGEEGATQDFDAPAAGNARDPGWQAAQANALRQALRQRGVPLWTGELPPELRT